MAETPLTIAEASRWASRHYRRRITSANISYLVTYGRVNSRVQNGSVMIATEDLRDYYDEKFAKQEVSLQELTGDINRRLAFTEYSEKERTKHVHRLHPYKGKFIPQLVEYFLDDHVDEFKREVFFKRGDIVLDPFCGSGTTLAQASELGLHAVGVDVSAFNTMLANAKVRKHNLPALMQTLRSMTGSLMAYYSEHGFRDFDEALSARLSRFNAQHFPSPAFKIRARNREIDAGAFGAERSREFESVYYGLVSEYRVPLDRDDSTFFGKWYLPSIRGEIRHLARHVEAIDDDDIRDTVCVILSRVIRSARATPHLDLATLREPVYATYYCQKHLKICKPLFTLTNWWRRYCDDALRRFAQFDQLRSDTIQLALCADARDVALLKLLEAKSQALARLAHTRKIAGIFTSPPYVGMIDYHEQHAYAYELLGLDRRDQAEIGPLFRGKGKAARESYVQGIAAALLQCQRFLVDDPHVFLVANDKHDLYPRIAEKAGLRIVNRFERPVLRRSEFDRSAYSESIFHMQRL